MKKLLLIIFSMFIILTLLSTSKVNADEPPVPSQESTVNINEELLEKYINSLEKDHVDKKDLYEALIQTKNDKIALLQGNISVILTWGGIILAIAGIAFTIFAFWLNRLFSNKVDEINKKIDTIQKISGEIENSLQSSNELNNSISEQVESINDFYPTTNDIKTSIGAIDFELKFLKAKMNFELLLLKFKNTLEEIKYFEDKIDQMEISEEGKDLLIEEEYQTFIKRNLKESKEDFDKWSKESITEISMFKLDEDEDEASIYFELDCDHNDALYRLQKLKNIYNMLLS